MSLFRAHIKRCSPNNYVACFRRNSSLETEPGLGLSSPETSASYFSLDQEEHFVSMRRRGKFSTISSLCFCVPHYPPCSHGQLHTCMLRINIHFILKTITSMFSPLPWISLLSRAFSQLSCSPERNELMKEKKILIMGEERRPVDGALGPPCLFPAD